MGIIRPPYWPQSASHQAWLLVINAVKSFFSETTSSFLYFLSIVEALQRVGLSVVLMQEV